MDRVFDHEDPNNRPEKIPMDDLGSYDDDDEYFDAHDLDMMETTFSGGGTEMFDKEGRPITPLANSLEYQIIQRDRVLRKKANIVKSAILDVTGKHWDARLDSLNTRDFLNNIEIKGDRESIWYKGKIVYKKVAGKYVMSSDKRSIEYIQEFRQQLTDINIDFAEGNSSDQQKIEQLVTINTILKNNLTDIPVEIETKPTIKGIIDNALNFDPKEVESPETVVNEVENAIYDIKSARNKTDDPEIQKYFSRLIDDYLENNVDILCIRHGLSTKYNNLDETDYGRLRRLKDFLKRNFGVIAFTTTVVGGLAGLVITIVSFVRSSVGSAASSASNAGEKTWDFAKKVGAILAPILTALATVLSWSASVLAWLASNLWFLFIVIAGIVYNILK